MSPNDPDDLPDPIRPPEAEDEAPDRLDSLGLVQPQTAASAGGADLGGVGDGIGAVTEGAGLLADVVDGATGLVTGAADLIGSAASGAAELASGAGEVISSAAEGAGAAAEGCGGCSLALLVGLLTAGSAVAAVLR